MTNACALCESAGGRVVHQASDFRLIHAAEAGFPAFYRLVWSTHVAEFSDLPVVDRHRCMDAVAITEQLMRGYVSPTKMNVATLGNVVPHLHWHLIARFDWDTHFPSPVWASATRALDPARLADVEARLPALEAALCERLATLG